MLLKRQVNILSLLYNTLQKIYNKSGLGVPPENICGNFPRPNKYNYKFNGQELQEDLGLNMYDMDFRDYDPAIARWVAMDPVVHHSLSPYNAFDSNPLFWVDPSGADSQTLFDLDGGKHTVSSDDVINLWKSSNQNDVTFDEIFSYFNLEYVSEGNFEVAEIRQGSDELGLGQEKFLLQLSLEFL